MEHTSDRDGDGDFFSLVHGLLREQDEATTDERRDHDRRRYTCVQLVAPLVPGEPLWPGDFDKRTFDDLSETGFAYFAPRPPETRHVAVALGVAPFTFLTAVVVNQALVDGPEGRQHRIGCRFTGRLDGRTGVSD